MERSQYWTNRASGLRRLMLLLLGVGLVQGRNFYGLNLIHEPSCGLNLCVEFNM